MYRFVQKFIIKYYKKNKGFNKYLSEEEKTKTRQYGGK